MRGRTKRTQDYARKRIIQPFTCPWTAPIVLITNEGRTTRFCIDYWALSSASVIDAYSHPRIYDSRDALNGRKFFCAMGLMSRFWQIKWTIKTKRRQLSPPVWGCMSSDFGWGQSFWTGSHWWLCPQCVRVTMRLQNAAIPHDFRQNQGWLQGWEEEKIRQGQVEDRIVGPLLLH